MSRAVNAVVVGVALIVLLAGSVWYLAVVRPPEKVSIVGIHEEWSTVDATTTQLRTAVTFRNRLDVEGNLEWLAHERRANSELLASSEETLREVLPPAAKSPFRSWTRSPRTSSRVANGDRFLRRIRATSLGDDRSERGQASGTGVRARSAGSLAVGSPSGVAGAKGRRCCGRDQAAYAGASRAKGGSSRPEPSSVQASNPEGIWVDPPRNSAAHRNHGNGPAPARARSTNSSP